MNSFWRPLTTVLSEPDTPTLLIKCDFNSASYSVSLTDLTFMWTETLDRKQIIKRALNIETSIDPSEDASQMLLLLRHVRESLEGRDDTTITVHRDGNSAKLTLSASISLPSPLLPLIWPMHLIRASEAAFTNQFVLPSLSLCHLAKAQANSLLQHIKEKDHVINKLTDKMQSDGSDLGRIFPGAPAGKLGSKFKSRETAAKSVKGLGEFDEDQWRRRLMATNGTMSSIEDLVSSVFASDLIDVQDFSRSIGDPTGWRTTTSDGKPSTHKPLKASMQSPGLQIPQQKPHAEPDMGKIFQRQSTPPSLRLDAIENHRDNRKNMAGLRPDNEHNEDSTTDESDRDNILTPIREKASANDINLAMRSNDPQRHIRPGLSMEIDTERSMSPISESVPEGHITRSPSTSPPERHSHLGGGGPNMKASSPVVSERKESLPPAKPKHKLGKIGGKAKENSETPDSRKSHEDHSSHTPQMDHTPKRPDLKSNDDPHSPQRVTEVGKRAVQLHQGPPGKVSEEQANENRKRLQHDLERMSKAATKKKRKF